jgi:hypothetical protein
MLASGLAPAVPRHRPPVSDAARDVSRRAYIRNWGWYPAITDITITYLAYDIYSEFLI